MIFSIFEQAYSALKHNRRRAALTMLGMAWGIATVVILLAYGAGFERAIMTVFSSFGSNMIAVFPNRTSMQAGGSKAGAEIRFTLEDLDLITNAVPMVKRTSPMVDKQTNIRYDTRMFTFRTVGVYPVVDADPPHGSGGRSNSHRRRPEYPCARCCDRRRSQEEALFRTDLRSATRSVSTESAFRSSASSSTRFRMATTTTIAC